jgi:GMP synthase (glutamine-hydrolysing)
MKKCNVCVIQHHAVETLGILAYGCGSLPEGNAESLRMVAHTCRTFENQPVCKDMQPYDGLIIMGGPMSVYDSYPHIKEELRLIEQALELNKPILGICLGSQLLAAALGARVYPGKQKEIGWKSVRLNDFASSDSLWQGVPRSFMGFHWHGDIFDLPTGAVPLAESDVTPCQSFRYGQNAYGMLFHAEVTQEMIQGMVKEFSAELQKEAIKPEDVTGPIENHIANLHYIGSTVFSRWGALIK